jgi:uncharacterized iron-regulated membrane protein
MKRLLFLIHRWSGVALALFMVLWFFSGLLIVYASQLNQTRVQQWARAEILAPESGWLSLGETLKRSGAAFAQTPTEAAALGLPSVHEARLVRVAGNPLWQIEDSKGQRLALSAIDGTVQRISADDALSIASLWAGNSGGGQAVPQFIETLDNPAILRNAEYLKPFHRVSLSDGKGSELLISARTGEIVHASTTVERAMYWAGSWVHLFRFLDLAGLDKQRTDVLLWLAGFAFLATLTGLVVGWLRWRPGLFGKATYSGGRVHPYKQVWFTWHFWAGLVGGLVVLTWTLSAYLNGNPWQIFSPANPNKAEYARYVGKDNPRQMLDWRPAAGQAAGTEVVELGWRHLGGEAVLIAARRDGSRQVLNAQTLNAEKGLSETAVLQAVGRLAGTAVAGQLVLQTEYDNYYYPRHGRSPLDRPLPVWRVDLGDSADTRFYVDAQDGRLLLRQDNSRRAYRWLWSALHHWDIAGLYSRPLWDVWMLTWISFGLVLSVTSVVLGWRRLKATFRRKSKQPVANAEPELAGEGQGV